MSKSVIHKTNKSVLFNLLFQGAQQGMSLFFSIILARLLSPEEFGVIAVTNMIVYYANNFTNFGFNNALVQHSNLSRRHVDSVFTIDFTISAMLTILTITFSHDLAVFFHNPALEKVLRWMSLFYLLTTFYHIPVALMRREIEFRYLAVITFAQAQAISICSIILAYMGMSYWSIIIPTLAFTALTCPIVMVKVKWYPWLRYSHADMKQIYSFGIWNFIRTQFNLLVNKVDYFVIGRYLDVHSLGIYEKSFELSERSLTGISTPVNGIFFSTFSRIKDDGAKVKKVFLEASSLLALLCYPVLFGLIAVSEHFVYSCLGEQWGEAVMPIRLLASACLLRMLLGMVASVNVAIGKYKIHTILKVFSALFFVGLCFGVVNQGILAICWAFIIFNVVEFIGSFWIISRTISVSVQELMAALWCPFTGSLVMYCAVRATSVMYCNNPSSLLDLFCLVTVGVLVYGAWGGLFLRMGVVSLKISDSVR